ncbi:MAG: RidA family protein [Bacillota bacterium]
MVAAYQDGRIVRNFEDLEDAEEARKALSSGMWSRDWNEGPIMAQTWFIYKNMDGFLRELGGSLEDIVLQHVFMLDIRRDWLGHEAARRHFFADRPPAISTVEVGALVPPGALLEIEAYAYLP